LQIENYQFAICNFSMLFSSRIRLKPLAQLCHRLATATNAGIQDRQIWTNESERGSASQRAAASAIRDKLAGGQSITDALRNSSEFFPILFRQMVEVGEVSGRLGDIYKRLARHYDRMLVSRREFLGRLAWPLMQLGMALFVIGALIWVMGMLPANNTPGGVQFDMLGFGLVGNSGLVKYVGVLVCISILLLLLFQWLRSRKDWLSALQRLLVQLPLVGGAFKTLAIARFTWALQLVLDTPMDIRKALLLAFNSTGNGYYVQHAPEVTDRIQRGQSITQSLAATGLFPGELLDNIAVGEESGRLVESMQRAAEDYEERAASAISILAQIAGYAIWLLILVFMATLIIRLGMFYTNTIQEFAKPGAL
jgi:type IV pilus assembly protein PilC